MLKLVVNQELKENAPTCSTHCTMFDPISNQCALYSNIDTEKPSVFARCQYKIPIASNNKQLSPFTKPHRLKEIEIVRAEDENHDEWPEFAGTKASSSSNYPFSPDVDIKRSDAQWFVSPDQSFGCWIINHSRKRLIVVENDLTSINGKRAYSSLFPLHDHKAAASLASHMCWYVDQDGLGQYVLVGDGNIMLVSSPKNL